MVAAIRIIARHKGDRKDAQYNRDCVLVDQLDLRASVNTTHTATMRIEFVSSRQSYDYMKQILWKKVTEFRTLIQ